jgi:hypothetical protein
MRPHVKKSGQCFKIIIVTVSISIISRTFTLSCIMYPGTCGTLWFPKIFTYISSLSFIESSHALL